MDFSGIQIAVLHTFKRNIFIKYFDLSLSPVQNDKEAVSVYAVIDLKGSLIFSQHSF